MKLQQRNAQEGRSKRSRSVTAGVDVDELRTRVGYRLNRLSATLMSMMTVTENEQRVDFLDAARDRAVATALLQKQIGCR